MKKLELVPPRAKNWLFLFLTVLLNVGFLALPFLPLVECFAPTRLQPKPTSINRKNFYNFPSRMINEEDEDEEEKEFMDEPVTLPHGMEDTLTEQDLEGLTVPQLKQQLRLRGLKVSGRKRALMDRLLGGGDDSSSSSSSVKTIQELAQQQGKEFVDVTDYLDEEDRGKQVKTWTNNKDRNVIDAEFEADNGKEENKNDNRAEVWGSDARIVDDYEGRRLVVDCLSQLVVEFKGSNQSYVSALVVASRDALKPFLAGGEANARNQTQAEQRLREIQTKREKEHQIPRRTNDDIGSDEGDEERLYANVMSRDYSDWGKYTVTGAQLSASEVQGVLLLSDVYGAFSDDMQALAEKIAFECQPVVVMVPDLFRGDPWKEDSTTPGKNDKGQTYEQWRATHSDLRVSVDIRAAAANLRQRYGVSSIAVWGTCYGGGRALEAASGYLPDGRIHDVDGCIGPPLVNPMATIAWYPTRYVASDLFGKDRVVSQRGNEAPELAVMAVFAGKDAIPGATLDDAKKLKELLTEDPRVKDFLVKVFPDQDHGFAHIGLAANANADRDTAFERFVDDEFGGAGQVSLDDGEADVACLLSTAFMETYSRVFLPTTGSPISEERWSTDLEMKSLADANTRDIRREIEESLQNFELESFSSQQEGAGVGLRDSRERELAELIKSIQAEEGTDPGPYRVEDDDDLDTMYSKLKAMNLDFEFF